ncbi:MAG: hypothetical protein KDD82_09010 [Planctomycetes bacterium]|nr:hypothetical protein [Planctomycetota bacterium]
MEQPRPHPERPLGLRILREDPRCPYCHEAVCGEEPQLACNQCRAWHHQACWTEGGSRCSACGAAATGLEGGLQAQGAASQPGGQVWGDRVGPYDQGHASLLLLSAVGAVGFGFFMDSTLPHGMRPLVLAVAVGYALVACLLALLSWPSADRPSRLRVPDRRPRDPRALRAAISARFAQSEAVFGARGLSLHDPEGLELKHSLVLCMQSAQDFMSLVPLLQVLSQSDSGTALVLAVGEVSDEILAVFRVNCGQGIFPGLVLRARPEQLAALARASGGTVVPAGRLPSPRDVGRVTGVSFTADGVAFANGPRIPLPS